MFFEFGAVDTRDDCWVVTLQNLESIRHMKESILLSEVEKEGAERAKRENRLLEEARQDGHADHDLQLPKFAGVSSQYLDK